MYDRHNTNMIFLHETHSIFPVFLEKKSHVYIFGKPYICEYYKNIEDNLFI